MYVGLLQTSNRCTTLHIIERNHTHMKVRLTVKNCYFLKELRVFFNFGYKAYNSSAYNNFLKLTSNFYVKAVVKIVNSLVLSSNFLSCHLLALRWVKIMYCNDIFTVL